MNGLFDSFDLTASLPKQEESKAAQAKKNTTKAEPKIVTNHTLFSDEGMEEFVIELNRPKVSTLLNKLGATGDKQEKPKKTEKEHKRETDPTKILKSKRVTLEEKLEIIRVKVLEVLGKQRKNVVVIRTKEAFEDYVSKAIEFGRVAVDTETNNSTDPKTCQLMGLCLYYEGGKQAYIPINHVNPKTGERLDWQLTEADCKEQLQRFKDAGTFIVMHNGKFDYEVIKCTCDIEIEPDWDTMIGAHTINENEKMGLKWQYIDKIDPTQAKYDIEHLFIVPYKYVDPEIFALYAATDSMMTDKLYLYQVAIIAAPGNERLYWLFTNIEMPIVKVAGDMELIGVCIDQEFGERLRLKFNQQLEEIDERIEVELVDLRKKINYWRTDPHSNANDKARQYEPKKTKLSFAEIQKKYPKVDEATGKRYKEGKSLSEQLSGPINLASPTQLAIIFYDVLGYKSVSKKAPRGTGKEELEALADRYDNALCKLILERRGIVKLISTYIDVLPALARHWPDGRIRYKLNSVGTDTGRFSSGGEFKFLEGDEAVEISGFNSQNIPSRGDGKITRLLFEAKREEGEVTCENDYYSLQEISEIETADGWKFGKDLVIGDKLVTNEGFDIIKNIVYENKQYIIYV